MPLPCRVGLSLSPVCCDFFQQPLRQKILLIPIGVSRELTDGENCSSQFLCLASTALQPIQCQETVRISSLQNLQVLRI